MPCTDTRSYDSREVETQISKLTRVCCELSTVLRRGGTEADLTAEARHWIAEHDEEDASRIKAEEARIERERIFRSALSKLTLDERRALGH